MSALCLGVASHLALDAIPHGDAGIGHWVHSSPNHVTKLQRLLPMVFVDQILGAGVFFSSSFIPPYLPPPLSGLFSQEPSAQFCPTT